MQLVCLAQQTLGGITGEVTDASGGVIPNATVTVVDEQTSLTRTAKTNGAGVYSFVNLPIDTYTLTFTADGFDMQKTPHITVQADRTATVNAALKVGQTSVTVEVEAVAADECRRHHQRLRAGYSADRIRAPGDRQLHGRSHPFRRRQR